MHNSWAKLERLLLKSEKVGSKLYSKGEGAGSWEFLRQSRSAKKAKLPSSFNDSWKFMSAFWHCWGDRLAIIGAKVNNRVETPTGTERVDGKQLLLYIHEDVECAKSLNHLARQAHAQFTKSWRGIPAEARLMRTFLKERKLRFNQLTAEQFFMETLTRGLIKMRLLTCVRPFSLFYAFI